MAVRDERSGEGLTDLHGLAAQLLVGRGGAQALGLRRLDAQWPELVGKALAQHTWPEQLVNGCLTIAVSHPTWHTTLRTMERKLLTTLQRKAGGLQITQLRVVIGRGPRPRPTAPAALDRPRDGELDAIALPAAAVRQIEGVLARIEDEAVRDRMRATMLRQQQLRLWRLQHGWRAQGGELLPPADRTSPE